MRHSSSGCPLRLCVVLMQERVWLWLAHTAFKASIRFLLTLWRCGSSDFHVKISLHCLIASAQVPQNHNLRISTSGCVPSQPTTTSTSNSQKHLSNNSPSWTFVSFPPSCTHDSRSPHPHLPLIPVASHLSPRQDKRLFGSLEP